MGFSLTARHIVKRYGGVWALRDGNLEVTSGKVIALLGANGSGKSTLSKIMTGVVPPSEGELHLTVDGKTESVHFANPHAAKKRGIVAVYQELSLIPDMTVSENIWLTHEPMRAGLMVNRRKMRQRTQELLKLFEGTFSDKLRPETLVTALPPDERQIVEILKALSNDPRMIILDEATASLDSSQVNRLFELVRTWKEQQIAVVIITHRMDEVFRIADEAMVLRNGSSVGTADLSETSEDKIVQMMIEDATSPEDIRIPAVTDTSTVRLEVKNLSAGRVQNVNIKVHEGELIGLGGLQGQGQADLLRALFGAIPASGDIILNGEQVKMNHPRTAMQHKVAFVPGDRGREGLLLTRSILENFQLASWNQYGVPLKVDKARADATGMADDLSLVYSGLDAQVNSLSGGNAQKVVIGKWLLRKPEILLLNDPTKGVDVGAKGEFYALIKELTESGTAIIFYSSDDDELLGLCNRVLVLQDGSVTAELKGDALNRENLVAASMGAL